MRNLDYDKSSLIEDYLKETVHSNNDVEILREIIKEVKNYDVLDIIARLSSLNLLIENQNKGNMFDVFIASLLSQKRESFPCKNIISNSKFKRVIDRLNNLSIRTMIDPAENMFIERVRYYGNYWIFPGITPSSSFHLQGLIDVLRLGNLQHHKEFLKKAHMLINFILEISNDIAQCLGYGMDTIMHIETESIIIPNSVDFEVLKNSVRFEAEIVNAMIPDESVRESLLIDFGCNDLSQVTNAECQEFYYHPFIKTNDEAFIVLNPSILVPFTIHQIIMWADSYGIKGELINAYNERVWKKCKECFMQLGHYIIDEKKYGISLINDPDRKELILSAENNSLLYVHFFSDDGKDYYKSMFEQYEIDNEAPILQDRVDYFTDKLKKPGVDEIYNIILINSFYRTVCVKNKLSSYRILLSPYELSQVAINELGRDNFLSRYINARKKIKTAIPSSLIRELNYIEAYTSNDYSFYISDDYDMKKTMIIVGLGDSIDYIIRAFKKEDRQLFDYYDNKSFCEVIRQDSYRNIYVTTKHGKQLPELVVKFKRISVWITTDSPSSVDEVDVFSSISDAVSYWLSEAKEIIDSMSFKYNSIVIKIVLLPPVHRFFAEQDIDYGFEDAIYFDHNNNMIKMMWTPKANGLFGNKSFDAEKELMVSVIEELGRTSSIPIDYDKVNELFINPVKRKILLFSIDDHPYLKPIIGSPRFISAEEENWLLDEIGDHFLSMPEYDYGQVPDNKRSELVKKVVGFLYSLLRDELGSLNPNGLYEQIVLDLEKAMSCLMMLQARYAFDISCYPERIDSIRDEYCRLNKLSVSLKFLAEYVASTPPNGIKLMGSRQYDRLLAICSLIIDWAYKNDLFYYHIINTPVQFLKSGRIGMSRSEIDQFTDINIAAKNNQLIINSNPEIELYTPTSVLPEFNEEIDDAFYDEYGYTFFQFSHCIFAIADYGEMIHDEVKKEKRSTIIKYVAEATDTPGEIIERIINQISLFQRTDFLVPPEPYKKYDVYPWRFNRELSFSRRPIIQYKDELIWGNRQLHHMLLFTIDLIIEGKYKARHEKLIQLIGKLSDKRGNEFNMKVAKKLSSLNELIVSEKLSKINGKRIVDENNNCLGDIDILYIAPGRWEIVVAEVKDFSLVKNPYEMYQEYMRFFVDGKNPCYMTKHRRRVRWVEDHIEDVLIHFNLTSGKWKVKSVLFVSKSIVSNDYFKCGERMIVYSDINEKSIKAV